MIMEPNIKFSLQQRFDLENIKTTKYIKVDYMVNACDKNELVLKDN